jgi:hypothetical protein
MAGFHEVVVCSETLSAIQKAQAENRSLWRVSSTLFSHIASDVILEPLGDFKKYDSTGKYPPTYTGDQVRKELEAINLKN